MACAPCGRWGPVLSSPGSFESVGAAASLRPKGRSRWIRSRPAAQPAAPPPLPGLPLRLHHHAYVVKDHEANRRFLEDLLGIPLVATWCEKSVNRETGEEIEFCHTFFGLADGSALAFFQFADPKMYEKTQAKLPAEIGRYDHIALKVDDSTYDALKARLDAAGEKFRETDHGYCKSIYTNSPDGLIVEFTCDPPDVEEIDAHPPRRRA